MHESVSRHKSRPRGLRAQVRTRLAAASTTFNGTFLRPNLSADGSIPASGPFYTSPDIWISGTQPIDPSTIITDASYGTQSGNNIALNETNYLYVRGKNGSSTAQTNTVQMYYAASSLIQWPSDWQNNVIQTDQGSPTSTITNLAAGAIGVAANTFQWTNVPPVPAGSDHYCVFAQLNDANDDNPFPTIGSTVDMSALITNNLGWGWRNTVEVAGATFSFNQMLTIPANLQAGTYMLYVQPKGYVGWQVGFTCSQLDSHGNAITMAPTTITTNGQFVGVPCYLEPGFSGSISLNLTQGNAPAANNGDTVSLNISYQTQDAAEAMRALFEGLVDWKVQRALDADSLPIYLWIPAGAQHFISNGQ